MRDNAERIVNESGLEIEFIGKKNFCKEAKIKKILEIRGCQPGLVRIFSAMEPCPSYKPWHNKQTHRTYLKPADGKCLHYYFYFIDKDLGLCYVRVPTWCPFRLQIFFNGHNVLANQLQKHGIHYKMLDNAFFDIDDFERIFAELQKNAKESIDIIAKNCGYSRQKVWGIINRLEENKTIWGYIAELHMMETLFPIRIQGILNPDIQKLKEFL